MKFQAPKSGLSEAISHVSRAVGSGRGDVAALAGVKVALEGDTLKLVCTNGELTIADSVKVTGEGSGVRLIPSRLLFDIVRSMPSDTVSIDCGDESSTEVKLTGGGAAFSLRTLPVEGFPRSEEPPEGGTTVEAGDFVAALRQVVPAASKDDTRGVLQGVLIAAQPDGLRLVATDSYRLAVVDVKGPSALADDQSVVVPSAALDAVTRLFGDVAQMTLRFGDRSLIVDAGELRLTTRLIEGEYPPYERVVPATAATPVTVSRVSLSEAVKRAKIVSGHDAIRLDLDPITKTATVAGAVSDIGAGQETIAVEYDGDAISVSFNPDYLLSGLDASPTEIVTLGIVDTLKPVKLQPAGQADGFTYVVMPVRA